MATLTSSEMALFVQASGSIAAIVAALFIANRQAQLANRSARNRTLANVEMASEMVRGAILMLEETLALSGAPGFQRDPGSRGRVDLISVSCRRLLARLNGAPLFDLPLPIMVRDIAVLEDVMVNFDKQIQSAMECEEGPAFVPEKIEALLAILRILERDYSGPIVEAVRTGNEYRREERILVPKSC